MIKYKLTAVIPVVQYGNLQPDIEIEGDNIEELHATAMAHISDVWAKYGERPLKASTGQIGGNAGTLVEMPTFTGETILFDEHEHRYYDKDGNVLLSGSAYADSVSPKFDKASILPKTAKAWGVDEKDLDDMWSISGRVSNEYGSSVHSALEAWFKYGDIGAQIAEKKGLEYNYVLPKNEYIRNMVLSFVETIGKTNVIPEVLISDVKNKMAGRIDLLEIIDSDKKLCRIGDYKTNNDLDKKKIEKYQHQLSYYAAILTNHGWTVQGLDIFHHDGSAWSKIEVEVLPVSV